MKKLLLVIATFVSAYLYADCVAKWDFEAENPLKATIGSDGVVGANASGATSVDQDGLGECYMTNIAEVSGLAIPLRSHVKLPIPAAVKNHSWTLRMRVYCPTESAGKFRTFVTTLSGSTLQNGALRLNTANNLGSATPLYMNDTWKSGFTSGKWHTLTMSADDVRTVITLDDTTEMLAREDTARLNAWASYDTLVLSGDNDGDDALMVFDYVEFYDETGREEWIRSDISSHLTGEWLFKADDYLKANVGTDLVKKTISGKTENFTAIDDAVVPGDGAVQAGQYNGFDLYHGLASGSAYTIVMDVRVPSSTCANYDYHALIRPHATGDLKVGLRYYTSTDGLRLFYGPSKTTDANVMLADEWARIAITIDSSKWKRVYVNGVQCGSGYTDSDSSVNSDHFDILIDNDGEDKAVDISYCAVYDYDMTAAEVARYFAHPHAQDDNGAELMAVSAAKTFLGNPLAATTWERDSAPKAATYVLDVMVPAEGSAFGPIVSNSTGVASGIYTEASARVGTFTSATAAEAFALDALVSTWGNNTFKSVPRGEKERIAIVWTAAGTVDYYVNGTNYVQRKPTAANTTLAPTATMQFLDGFSGSVTKLSAYDTALAPSVVALLGGPEAEGGDSPATPSFVSVVKPDDLEAVWDEVVFTVTATQPDGDNFVLTIDYGDGESDSTPEMVASGTQLEFRHTYYKGGTFTPVLTTTTQGAIESDPVSGTAITVATPVVATDMIVNTLPWQQNVYTNRFTIMFEATNDWPKICLQYGDGYVCSKEMTSKSSPGTSRWVYKVQIETNGVAGATIPYRLAIGEIPLTASDPTQAATGTVKLWPTTVGDGFKCAIWGDNQKGLVSGYWDADKFAFLHSAFQMMMAHNVDFGISTGDFTQGNKGEDYGEIKNCLLLATFPEFGRYKDFHVTWGNHDIESAYGPRVKEYFDTTAGIYHLWRDNVLMIFVHWGSYNATSKTYLANLLATDEAKNAKFRLLFQHAPFWVEVWNSYDRTLATTAINGGVDVVFSGHMHGYEHIETNGVVQVVNGCLGHLDYNESVNANYGDATKVGGHKAVPYMTAKQSSTGVLGALQPVKTSCVQGFGELEVRDNKLTYTQYALNSDGSYVGICDKFTLTSKTVAATSTPASPSSVTCANPSAYEEFLTKPVDNAAWKTYCDAVGITFTYAEGTGSSPVTGISREEIAAFLTWLNGDKKLYRLPTVSELSNATFSSVAEWTSTPDTENAWIRIANCQVTSIATEACTASYLGFRLHKATATGYIIIYQ